LVTAAAHQVGVHRPPDARLLPQLPARAHTALPVRYTLWSRPAALLCVYVMQRTPPSVPHSHTKDRSFSTNNRVQAVVSHTISVLYTRSPYLWLRSPVHHWRHTSSWGRSAPVHAAQFTGSLPLGFSGNQGGTPLILTRVFIPRSGGHLSIRVRYSEYSRQQGGGLTEYLTVRCLSMWCVCLCTVYLTGSQLFPRLLGGRDSPSPPPRPLI
jgi:hypothetical protein